VGELKPNGRSADHPSMAARLPAYDPKIIERAAEKLYGKAQSVVHGCIAAGIVVGAAFGAVPLTSLGDAWPIPAVFGFATALCGSLVGGVVGFVIGDTRAFGYRLQAQSTLCQVQLERNTATSAHALAALAAAETARLAAGPVLPAPMEDLPARAALGLVPPVSPPLSG
jgi:hypothetical protein